MKFLGLDPGSSSKYSSYVLACAFASTLDPTSALTPRPPSPPPAGEGGLPEASPEGPAGGALPKAHFYVFTRFGSTRAEKFLVVEPCFKFNVVVD